MSTNCVAAPFNWVRARRRDSRWWKNVAISGVVMGFNYTLMYYAISRLGYNGLAVNAVTSLLWDCVWYGINRFYLWKERETPHKHATQKSLLAWAVGFGINQACFGLMSGPAELSWLWAKIASQVVSALMATLRYAVNDKFIFCSKYKAATT